MNVGFRDDLRTVRGIENELLKCIGHTELLDSTEAHANTCIVQFFRPNGPIARIEERREMAAGANGYRVAAARSVP